MWEEEGKADQWHSNPGKGGGEGGGDGSRKGQRMCMPEVEMGPPMIDFSICSLEGH